MKILYIECAMGAAGDMLMSAPCELLPNPQDFVDRMNALGLPGVRFERLFTRKCGITGTRISVTVNGHEELEHGHEHYTDNHHSHAHHALPEIRAIIDALDVSDRVKANASAVYARIADAEAEAHGEPVDRVHFHEVGALDAVADVAGVCLLMELLGPDRVVVSPVHVGSGEVRCAHGILPVPAPATANILRGVPIYSGEIRGELCTPTGAALLAHFADSFGPLPPMVVEKTGYGMGTKDFERPNCVRVMLGNAFEAKGSGNGSLAKGSSPMPVPLEEERKLLSGLLYRPGDPGLKALKRKAHNLSQQYNDTSEDDTEIRAVIISELFDAFGEGGFIQGPMFIHYGCHTRIGKRFFGNFNLTIQDDAPVEIGDDCNFGPNVTIVTPIHPYLPAERRAIKDSEGNPVRVCYARPVRIGNDCWFGANIVVCPGVTIGSGCIIGAGSVVTRDIPDNSLAAGDPCHVIRKIDEKDSLRHRSELLGEYCI